MDMASCTTKTVVSMRVSLRMTPLREREQNMSLMEISLSVYSSRMNDMKERSSRPMERKSFLKLL